ncbi:Putative oxidoreductase GLYR1 [Tupaia chinensis]|uniref:Nuclear protein NP60 n=1 Tax=Tupaia chinensis TaxID=246437 RepID=L9KTA5_TUPCH|nr:Putative oxidoreductase GLYR1 [Tupaia chinensis]
MLTFLDLKKPRGKKCFYVKFFGTEEQPWIKVEQPKPYHAHKEEMIKINKGKRFQQAMDAIEEFLRRAKGKDQTSSHNSAYDKNEHNSSEERSRPNSGDEKLKSLSEGKVKKNMGEGKKRVSSGSSEEEARLGRTVAEVVSTCDITFACVSALKAAKDLVLDPSGVLQGICLGKCYVNMSTVDAVTVTKLDQLIVSGGPLSGSPGLRESAAI